jgi:DNA polymerase-3 subunit alpha
VVSRQERRTKTGNKMGILGLSDPTGHFEAVIFSEGLAQYRDLLEPGASVLLFLAAEAQGDEVRCRIQNVQPLDDAAEQISRSLRVYLRDAAPIESVARRLDAMSGAPDRHGRAAGARLSRGEPGTGGEGEVSRVLLLNEAEVEIRLPGRFKVSPQIAGAIKAVPGVVQVEAV